MKNFNETEFNLFIVDNNTEHNQSIKAFLESKLEENIIITSFQNLEACLHVMNGKSSKPDVVILDNSENKELDKETGEHTVDYIKRIHPSATIIMISEEEHSIRAMKALGFGAHNFVIKNQFSHEHILSSVRKCLHPVKV
ncbi:MAG TPA: response regulator [Bacteroidia bacterium]|jgi:DNA-binding NarL/FixJ family response regulator